MTRRVPRSRRAPRPGPFRVSLWDLMMMGRGAGVYDRHSALWSKGKDHRWGSTYHGLSNVTDIRLLRDFGPLERL